MLEKHLASGIVQLGLDPTPEMQRKLLQYMELLHKWNKVYNLTAVRNIEQMVSNHLLDCLAVVPHLWPTRWIDVGCGGGLPGLVLAIVQPEWSITLLDSNSKKTSFVQQASIELGLKNVAVHCERVEEFVSEHKFDGIISRAFAETADFVNLTRHIMAENGRWAAMKGIPNAELNNLPSGIVVEKVLQLRVPGMNAARCLVVLKEDK